MYAYMWTWLDTAMDCMEPCLESIAFLFATNCYVTPRNDSGTTVERRWNDGGTTVGIDPDVEATVARKPEII